MMGRSRLRIGSVFLRAASRVESRVASRMAVAVLAVLAVLLLCGAAPVPGGGHEPPPPGDRAAAAAARVRPALEAQLARAGLRWGAPVFLRIFKEESQLEVWVDDGMRFRLFRRYPVCTWSGALGPKLRQGDGQS